LNIFSKVQIYYIFLLRKRLKFKNDKKTSIYLYKIRNKIIFFQNLHSYSMYFSRPNKSCW